MIKAGDREEDEAIYTDATAANTTKPSAPAMETLLEQYGCGPVRFTGAHNAFYERHLLFDSVLDPEQQVRESAMRQSRAQ